LCNVIGVAVLKLYNFSGIEILKLCNVIGVAVLKL